MFAISVPCVSDGSNSCQMEALAPLWYGSKDLCSLEKIGPQCKAWNGKYSMCNLQYYRPLQAGNCFIYMQMKNIVVHTGCSKKRSVC